MTMITTPETTPALGDADSMPVVAAPSPAAKPRPARAPQPVVSKSYVAAWVCIGGVSAAYLAAAVLDPDLLADLTRNGSNPVLEASSPPGLVRQTVANMQSLQKAVTALAGDVANLKSTAHLQAVRQAETGERVAQIEGRLSGIAAAAPLVPGLPRVACGAEVTPLEPLPAASKLAEQMAAAAPEAVPAKPAEIKNQGRLSVPGMIVQINPPASPPVTPAAAAVAPRAAPPAETRASRQALKDPALPDQAQVQLLPSSIETGGINRLGALAAPAAAVAPPVAAAPIPATQTKAAPPVKPRAAAAVQIAAGPSVDALRLSWMLLSDRHSNVLKPLEPRFVSDEAGVYRLVAGPFASAAEAQRACADLKARGAICQATEFSGDAL